MLPGEPIIIGDGGDVASSDDDGNSIIAQHNGDNVTCGRVAVRTLRSGR
ncbi:hypothetical protein [Umezawaea tangerina]|nr:hypothetical protein [Umezawaea tangerina]